MTNREELLHSAEELCRAAEQHRQLMQGKQDRQKTDSHPCMHKQMNTRLRQAICESITVIEDTKRAFKSKRLEELRKKLIQLLAEEQ